MAGYEGNKNEPVKDGFIGYKTVFKTIAEGVEHHKDLLENVHVHELTTEIDDEMKNLENDVREQWKPLETIFKTAQEKLDPQKQYQKKENDKNSETTKSMPKSNKPLMEQLKEKDKELIKMAKEHEKKLSTMAKEQEKKLTSIKKENEKELRRVTQEKDQKISKLKKENEDMKSKFERIGKQTSPSKDCIQIFYDDSEVIVQRNVNELRSMIQGFLKEIRITLKLCHKRTDLRFDLPILIVCMVSTRDFADITLAIKDIPDLSNTAVLVFHNIEPHNPRYVSSKNVLDQPECKTLSCIIDFKFSRENGIYTCGPNNESRRQLQEFIRANTRSKQVVLLNNSLSNAIPYTG